MNPPNWKPKRIFPPDARKKKEIEKTAPSPPPYCGTSGPNPQLRPRGLVPNGILSRDPHHVSPTRSYDSNYDFFITR
jgi:hypothetical protein